eukprot:TRINITY_DN22919_c0_g1_i1.p1 TRINITY_DN22919_c0_g1~~TRINITY_DN22919_c0_g1_i1.p1  ORF type:complete len:522 (+),score=105.61 TRINITY_DN22919_c0_g1_i1:533-2098(+)
MSTDPDFHALEKELEADASSNVQRIPKPKPLPPQSSPSNSPGTRHGEKVGKYVIGDLIGRGGFANVYKALNLESGQVVAAKKFDKSKIAADQEHSIKYEIDLLTRLKHENIVPIIGKDETEHNLYIFMAFMENGSLKSMLTSFGTFPEQLAALFLQQMLRGLVYLHDAGVVHRDIKAANILLNREGVKLADFGVAAEVSDAAERFSVVGTPYWMAPEVIEITGHSTASDIWSVGSTLLELLTGAPPYFHLNPIGAMFRIVQDPYPPFPSGISKDLETFLQCCFRKQPEHRLTANELLFHPWITSRTAALGKVPTAHDEIKHTVDTIRGTKKKATRVPTAMEVFQQEPTTHSPSATADDLSELAHTNDAMSSDSEGESIDSLDSVIHNTRSRVSSIESEMHCSNCARLEKKLEEAKKKKQEILLAAMNYIASGDMVEDHPDALKQQMFRDSLRQLLEDEFTQAFPDDNIPRFMQRRLTVDQDNPFVLETTAIRASSKENKKRERKRTERAKEARKETKRRQR